MTTMKSLAVLAGLMATGCAAAATTGSISPANPYPENYREVAKQYVLANFKDPYSIRDAYIAPPKLAPGPILLPISGFATPWYVCIRANAKNSFGAYIGATPTTLLVYNGRVENSWEGSSSSAYACSGAEYVPFPEINGKSSG